MTVAWTNPNDITYPDAISFIFGNVMVDLITLHVPAGSESLYETHGLWGGFIIPCATEGSFDNISWNINSADILTITGTGDLPDYEYGEAPWSCTENIRHVIIGNEISRIGNNAFSTCFELEEMTVAWSDPNDIAYGNGTIFGNLQISSVTLHVPAGSETLYMDHELWGNFIINYCPNEGTIGNISWSVNNTTLTITGTGDLPDYEYGEAPWSCNINIRHIIIGNGISRIGNNNFSSLFALEEMTVAWTDPNDIAYGNGTIFGNVQVNLVTLHVPEGSEALYFNHELWGNFIIDYCPEEGTIENINWHVEGETLTLLGEGAIGDYPYNSAPWACNTGITCIAIHKEINRIGAHNFSSFANLQSMVVAWDDPQMVTYGNYNDIFGDVAIQSVELHVPAGTEYRYRSHPLWGSFIINDVTQGTLENIEWHFEYGTLFVSGDGEIPVLYDSYFYPWNNYHFNIHEIKILDHITGFNHETFLFLHQVTTLSIAKSVSRLPDHAFFEMPVGDITVFWDDPHDITYENDFIFNTYEVEEIVLHVPYGKKEAYESHPVWSQFTIIDDVQGDIEVNDIARTSATITWSDIPDAHGFTIEVYSDAALTNVIASETLYSTAKETGFVFEIHNLTPDARYFYVITSFDGNENTLTHTEGSFKTLGGVGIGSINHQPISVYPNPASDIITITGIDNDAEISIFDLSGKKLIATHTHRIDVSPLSKGAYIIRSNERTGKLIVK